MPRFEARLVAKILMVIALGACDTFGPPPDQGVCGGDGSPCSTPPTLRPPSVVPPPSGVAAPVAGTPCITCSKPPSLPPPFPSAGIGGNAGATVAGQPAIDGADAGVEP